MPHAAEAFFAGVALPARRHAWYAQADQAELAKAVSVLLECGADPLTWSLPEVQFADRAGEPDWDAWSRMDGGMWRAIWPSVPGVC